MTPHVKILAWIHVVMGGGMLLVGIALLVGVFFADHRHTLPFLFELFSSLAIGLFIPLGVSASRTRRQHPCAVSR